MRTLVKVAVVLAVVALLASPALAQQPRGGGFGGGLGVRQLLENKSVQEELKIESDQLTKVTDVLKKVADDNKELVDKLAFRPGGGGTQLSREERAELTKKLNEAYLAGVKDTLKPEQITRLKQVQVQVRGLAAY